MKKICASILFVSSSVFGITFVNEQDNHQSQTELTEVRNPSQNNNLQNILSRDAFNEEALQELLDSGTDINEEIELETPPSSRTNGVTLFYDGKGTVLFHATRFNMKELAIWLVEHEANVNKATADGYTPLIMASRFGNKELVQYLVEHGADVNATTTDEKSPLSMAFRSGNLNLFHYLVENGAEINNEVGASILFQSILNENLEFIEYLIGHGVDINMKPKYGYPPLLAALEINSHPLTELFIELGAKVEGLRDKNGMTPLLLAMRNGCDEEVYRYLIENSDDINVSAKGYTPLLIASQYGSENLVRLLVEKGAEVNVANSRGKTPLTFAVCYKNISLTIFLLEHGANNIQKENSWGNNPLLLAQDNVRYERDLQRKAEWRKIIRIMKEIIEKQQ